MNKLINILLILTLVFWLSSCAFLDKLRGVANPHTEMLVIPPVVTEGVVDLNEPVVNGDGSVYNEDTETFTPIPIVTEDIRG